MTVALALYLFVHHPEERKQVTVLLVQETVVQSAVVCLEESEVLP